MTLRASQIVVEALVVVGGADVRASQISIEALVQASGASVFVSQILLEALIRSAGAAVRASQSVLEVAVWNYEVPMPSIYPVLPGLTYSVIKRPKWFTGVGTSSIGREVRVAYAQFPLWEWDLTYNYLPDKPTASSVSASDFKTLIGFYLARSGSFQGFAFEDPDDNTVTAQAIGTTDGTTREWVFSRTFGIGSDAIVEPIGWLNQDTPLHIYLNGTLANPSTYTLLLTQGCLQQIIFNTAPTTGQTVSADFSFYYSVRFKDDHLDFEKFMDKLWSQATITLMSQRD